MDSNFMPRLNPSHGFTLLELLITVAVASILMAIAIPNFSKWRVKHEINGQTQKVFFDLMLARSTAIKNSNDVLITFNEDKNIYTVSNDINGNGIEDFGENLKSVNLENNVEFGYNPGVYDVDGNLVTSSIFLGSRYAVTFNSKGQASKSGSIFLIHKNDIGVSNNRLRSINILQATGAIELLKYDSDSMANPWS